MQLHFLADRWPALFFPIILYYIAASQQKKLDTSIGIQNYLRKFCLSYITDISSSGWSSLKNMSAQADLGFFLSLGLCHKEQFNQNSIHDF